MPAKKLTRMAHSFIPFDYGVRTYIGKYITLLKVTKPLPEPFMRHDFELVSEKLQSAN